MNKTAKSARYPDRDDSELAARLAAELRDSLAVKAWMKRLRKLMKDQPWPDQTWLYMQESTLHLMARPAKDGIFKRSSGSDPAASIDSVDIPGADAGAW